MFPIRSFSLLSVADVCCPLRLFLLSPAQIVTFRRRGVEVGLDVHESYTRTAELKVGECDNVVVHNDHVDLINRGTRRPTDGCWTLVFNSTDPDHSWADTVLSWHDGCVPGTSLTVNVSTSRDGVEYCASERVKDGTVLADCPDGKWLKVQVFFHRDDPSMESPHLYRLDLDGGCLSDDDCRGSARGECVVGRCDTDSRVCYGFRDDSRCPEADPDEPCDEDDVCARDGSCVSKVKEDGATCDDGRKCTRDDKCEDGMCRGILDCDSYDEGDCGVGRCDDDGDCYTFLDDDLCDEADEDLECDAHEECKEGGICEDTKLDDGEECDDDDECTEDDECQAGICVGTPIVCRAADPNNVCDVGEICDDGRCEPDGDSDGDPCNDNNACTDLDECDGGSCIGTLVGPKPPGCP